MAEPCGALPRKCSFTYLFGVLRTHGKQDLPIAISGAALEHVLRNLPSPSKVIIMPET
jgi:hypothetical protein